MKVGRHPNLHRQCAEALASPCTTKSNGEESKEPSSHWLVWYASFPLSLGMQTFGLCLKISYVWPFHSIQRYIGDGRPNNGVKGQWTTLSLKPHLMTPALLQANIILRVFLTLVFTCSFLVSRTSKITPRYLIDQEHYRVVQNNLGSKTPASFLFRVKATSPVFSELTDDP